MPEWYRLMINTEKSERKISELMEKVKSLYGSK
jgi:hypothetical protein